MIALLVFAQIAGAAVPPYPRPQGDIVVVGQALTEEEALARCLARGCPVDDAAAAAIALSRRQFVAGDYERARATLVAALGRHRRDGRAHPLQVAALWREKGKVEAHLGEYELFRSSQLQNFQTLRRGLPEGDPARLEGLVALGDMQVRVRERDHARQAYRTALAAAERAGDPRMIAVSRYRLAGLVAYKADTPDAGDERYVAGMLAPLVDGRDPELARFGFVARLLKARVAERRGRQGAVATLLRSLPPGTGLPPVLVSSPRIDLARFRPANCVQEEAVTVETDGKTYNMMGCGNPRDLKGLDEVAGQWVDVRFRIDPDGEVAEAALVRRSDAYTGDWGERVVDAVRARRYAVVSAPGLPPQLDRLERFTLTAPFQMITGDLMRTRSRNVVVESADLTPAPAPVAAAG